QTVVSSGGLFQQPLGLAVAPNGTVYVADAGASGQPGSIIAVSLATGTQTLVSTGGLLVDPSDVAIAANGDLLVADPHAGSGTGAVIRIVPPLPPGVGTPTPTPGPGVQSLVSSGGLFSDPVGIALDASGNILIADATCACSPGGIIRVNPATGQQTDLAG